MCERLWTLPWRRVGRAEYSVPIRFMGVELKSMEFLLERRKLYTESSWEALYQQNPFIVGGGIFPIEKLTTWR